MEQTAAALGDAARRRIVELLAERPRSVGELSELTGLRQPQTTKHLQTLGRAGLVTVHPLGQRRVYALEVAPLDELRGHLQELVEIAGAHAGEVDVLARYRAAIDAETAAAGGEGWADGRTFSFDRVLPSDRATVWRYWTEPELLASWWAPPSMTVSEVVLQPRRGGRAVLEYRDAEGRYRSEGRVAAAKPRERLTFDLSVQGADGATAFTADYDVTLADDPAGTRFHLGLHLHATTVEAAPSIAGIEIGWGQVLDRLTTLIDLQE